MFIKFKCIILKINVLNMKVLNIKVVFFSEYRYVVFVILKIDVVELYLMKYLVIVKI